MNNDARLPCSRSNFRSVISLTTCLLLIAKVGGLPELGNCSSSMRLLSLPNKSFSMKAMLSDQSADRTRLHSSKVNSLPLLVMYRTTTSFMPDGNWSPAGSFPSFCSFMKFSALTPMSSKIYSPGGLGGSIVP